MTRTTPAPEQVIDAVGEQAEALSQAEAALARVREKAERAVREAQTRVEDAEDELAERRRAAVGVYAAAWAEHAQALEAEAEECPEGETVTLTRYGRAGIREPVLAFKRDELAREAAGARAEADRLTAVASWRWEPPGEFGGRQLTAVEDDASVGRRAEVMHRVTLSNTVAEMVLPPGQAPPTE